MLDAAANFAHSGASEKLLLCGSASSAIRASAPEAPQRWGHRECGIHSHRRYCRTTLPVYAAFPAAAGVP
jgi:hypothetical protein